MQELPAPARRNTTISPARILPGDSYSPQRLSPRSISDGLSTPRSILDGQPTQTFQIHSVPPSPTSISSYGPIQTGHASGAVQQGVYAGSHIAPVTAPTFQSVFGVLSTPMDVEQYQPQGMDRYLKELQEKEKNMMELFTTVQQKTEESHQLQLTCQHQAAQIALM